MTLLVEKINGFDQVWSPNCITSSHHFPSMKPPEEKQGVCPSLVA